MITTQMVRAGAIACAAGIAATANAQSINLIQCDHIVDTRSNAADLGGTASDSDNITANNTLCVDFVGSVNSAAGAPAGDANSKGGAAQKAGVSATEIEVTGRANGAASVDPTAIFVGTNADSASNTQSRFFFDAPSTVRFTLSANVKSSVTATGNDTASAAFDFIGSGVNTSLNLLATGTNAASGSAEGWIQPSTLYVLAGSAFTSVDADLTSGTAFAVSGAAGVDYVLRIFCAADFDTDGVVDITDLSGFSTAWTSGSLSADFNDDGVVDIADLNGYIAAFTAGC